jgi:hypothetical protein
MFFYNCRFGTNELYMTNLSTGEQSLQYLCGYLFKYGCLWSELPGGCLLVTGGDETRDVVKIDTLREWAVSSQPRMHTGRSGHAAVFHTQYLYVVGGKCKEELKKCERYVCAERRWERLPALPVASCQSNVVVLDNSLYAVGGYYRRNYLNSVQRLYLDSLTWELMQLKLPKSAYKIPFFKTNTQVYLIIGKILYSFTPLKIKRVKAVSQWVTCNTR